jgi:hypothetical protein
MDMPESVKGIKPVQWAMIAGAGLGVGILLRLRAKNKAAAATTTATTTDTPFTGNATQQYGDYSGTGQTGFFQGGAATIDPNAPSTIGTAIIPLPANGPPTVMGPETRGDLIAGSGINGAIPRPTTLPVAPAPVAAVASPPPAIVQQPPVSSQEMYWGMMANPSLLNQYLINGGLVAGKDNVGLSGQAQIKEDLTNRVRSGQLPQSVLDNLYPGVNVP